MCSLSSERLDHEARINCFWTQRHKTFIKGKTKTNRKINRFYREKILRSSKRFLRRYNTSKTPPAGQQYILDQTLAYLKGQQINSTTSRTEEAAKALNKEFVEIRTLFRDVLPEGSGLRDFFNNEFGLVHETIFVVFLQTHNFNEILNWLKKQPSL